MSGSVPPTSLLVLPDTSNDEAVKVANLGKQDKKKICLIYIRKMKLQLVEACINLLTTFRKDCTQGNFKVLSEEVLRRNFWKSNFTQMLTDSYCLNEI